MSETVTATCNCGRPTSGAILCETCKTTLAYAITHVGVYGTDLETVAGKQTRYGAGSATKGSIGKTQPLVVDLRFAGALEDGTRLRDDAWNTVHGWTRTVTEDVPERAGPTCPDCRHVSCGGIRRDRHPADTLASMIHYLARQYRYLLVQPWIPDMLDEFCHIEDRLRRFVDRPPDRWYAGKCSASDAETGNTCTAELYATTERGTVTCPDCETRHDITTRRDFLLDEAKGYAVTATEAARALLAWTDYDGTEKKLIDRIAYWRDQDLLAVADVTSLAGRDRHLYLLGDIQTLLIAAAQTRQTRRIGPETAA